MGRPKHEPDNPRPKKPDPAKSKPPVRQHGWDDDSDAGDIATPEPDRDDEQHGL